MPLWLLACGWLCVLAWRTLAWLARHPRCTVVLAVAGVLLWSDTVLPAAGVAGLLACGLAGWWAVDPGSFRALVLARVQLELRQWWLYRRNWQPAMLTAGLSLREHWGGDLPVLRSVRDDGGMDVLRVRMLPGQTLDTWRAAAPALASTFGARQVRVRRVPSRVQEADLLVTHRVSRSKSSSVSAVTKPLGDTVTETDQAPRGAFPRAPRGGAA